MSNLQEILDHINYKDGGVKEAQAAIAELVEGCLPEKDMVNNDDPVANAHAESHNNAIDQIRNNLKAKGIL